MENKDYKKVLSLIKKEETVLVGFIRLVPPTTLTQINAVRDMTKHVSDPKVIAEAVESEVLTQVESILSTKKKWGSHGRALAKLLGDYGDIISDKVKQKIVNRATGTLETFYPYAKKELLSVVIPWVKDEDSAIAILNAHHRNITTDDMDVLLGQITNGINHDGLKKIREHSTSFLAHSFQKADFNDADVRRKFIKEFAKMPSLIRHVSNVSVTITLDDLKDIPPARRFDFLQFLYQPLLGLYSLYSKNWWPRKVTKKNIEQARKNKLYTQISVEDVSLDDMKNLLFALSIRKNEMIQAWYRRYEQYLIKKSE